MEFFQCIPLEEARDIIIKNLEDTVVKSETVALHEALGRIVAEDIVAREDVPPFRRSTVDGFAVRSADTFGASEGSPSLFMVAGEIAMGKAAAIELSPGQAAAIPTGGMLPSEADAVVMLEYTEQPDDNTLLVLKSVAPLDNVISKGEDIQAGAVILKKGQKIVPQYIGALAACGCACVKVCRKPEVTVISTGDELVDIQETVVYGQIRDVNSYALEAMLTEAGCNVRRVGIVKDSYDEFMEVLAKARESCQLVIISGGSSVGARDYTVKAIEALDEPGILIHGVAIKPGRPTIFGMIGNVPVFGLPGHPVAAMTVCEQLVKLALSKLIGQDMSLMRTSIPALLTRNVASAPGRDDYINVQVIKQDGKYLAEPILGKSGLISILAKANGLLHISGDKSGAYAEELVEIILTKSLE